jgi:HNH endonuclease/AP2 domain
VITQKHLLQLVDYCPLSGVFTKKNDGAVCYSTTSDGYLWVEIRGKVYRVHRLAHLYMTGRMPKHQIDHRDRNRRNNMWENLREATISQNNINRSLQRNNTSGHKGVCRTPSGKWRTSIQINKKRVHLGTYECIGDAIKVYQEAARKFHGEYCLTN